MLYVSNLSFMSLQRAEICIYKYSSQQVCSLFILQYSEQFRIEGGYDSHLPEFGSGRGLLDFIDFSAILTF